MASKAGSPKRARAGKPTRRSGSGATRSPSTGTAGAAGKAKGKYNASGEHVNGVWCASAAEAERYRNLLRMDMQGMIDNLVTQPNYKLVVNNHLICGYRADFSYDLIDEQGNVIGHRIEDVKGFETTDFKLKRKLFDALMPVKLSVIAVGGKAVHPERPEEGRTVQGWLFVNWLDRIPD